MLHLVPKIYLLAVVYREVVHENVLSQLDDIITKDTKQLIPLEQLAELAAGHLELPYQLNYC